MTRRHGFLRLLFEALTGLRWVTVRSAAREFGPPPGARYAAELSAYSDAELMRHGNEIVAAIEARRRTRAYAAGESSDRVAAGPNPAGSSSHDRRAGSVSSSRHAKLRAEAYHR